MKIEERLQILQQIENVAALAGSGHIDDDARHFAMSFNTERDPQPASVCPPERQDT